MTKADLPFHALICKKRNVGIVILLSLTVMAESKPPSDVGLIRAQNADRPWSRTVRSGVDRFEVRSGDHLAGDGLSRERSEIFSSRKLDAGKTFVIAFDMRIEPGRPSTAAWLILTQLQSTFDKGDSPHSPPFAIEMAGERMRIVSRADPRRISAAHSFAYTRHYEDARDIQRDRWYRFKIQVRFDPFGNGVLAVSRDGVRLVDYHGAIGFDDAAGAYLKQGVYRASATETFAARFRRLQIRAVER